MRSVSIILLFTLFGLAACAFDTDPNEVDPPSTPVTVKVEAPTLTPQATDGGVSAGFMSFAYGLKAPRRDSQTIYY